MEFLLFSAAAILGWSCIDYKAGQYEFEKKWVGVKELDREVRPTFAGSVAISTVLFLFLILVLFLNS